MSSRVQTCSSRAIIASVAGYLLLASGLITAPAETHANSENIPPTDVQKPMRLVAAIPQRFLPIFDVSENQLATGFGVEFMELVAAHAQVKIDYRVLPDWEAVYAALRSGEADLVPSMGITAQRSRDFAFSDPTVSFTLRLFVRSEDANRLRSLDDVARQRGSIAVVESNFGKTYLAGSPNLNAVPFNSLPDALVALRGGDVDALLFPAEVVWYLGRKLGIEAGIESVGEPLAEIPRGIAVRKDRTELLALLNPSIRAVTLTPDYELALRRWFPQAQAWWTARHTVILLAGLVLAAAAAAAAMRHLGLRRAHERLRVSMALNQAVLDTALEAILTVDGNDTIHSANRAAARMLGRPEAELIGSSICSALAPPAQMQCCVDTGFSQLYGQLDVTGDDAHEGIEMNVNRNQETFPVRARMTRLRDFTPPLLMLTLQDVSALRQAENYARYLTDHDPLTGLLNHRGALLLLDNLLARAARTQQPVCCIMLGLDRFTQFNELYGRTAGDAQLTAVATHLSASVRHGDVLGHEPESLLARTGGNRFLIVLADVDTEGGRAVCERILSRLSTVCIDTGSSTARCDAHAGIAGYPHHATHAAELVSHAEITLQAAREDRVHRTAVFSQDLQSTHHEEGRVVQMLLDALEQDRFVLHFQPVLNLRDGSKSHYETLVRIESDDGGLIMPGTFITTAERHGLIARIDYAVLRRVFAHLAGSRKGDDFTLAVNISAAHFGDSELRVWLEAAFAEKVVSPRQLVFEITETAALHNIAMARDFMGPLKALGCRFALDDFGVGFSSFEYLRLLPVDFVKIDGSFIRNLPESPEDRAIARAITEVAHATGRQVIAEFVEGPRHLELVTEMGVDYAQGYHIGRPEPDSPHARSGPYQPS